MHSVPRLLRAALCAATFTAALRATVPAAEVTLPSTSYSIVAPSMAIATERQRELEWSARVYETLMGVAPPRGHVTLTDTPTGSATSATGEVSTLMNTFPLTPQPPAADGTVWNLSWFANEKAAAGGRGYTVLTHEAAHMQLIFTVNFYSAEALRHSFNGYGSFLPDWLDEAVAVYHEPDALKARRRSRFRLDARIPLRTFFAMNHPGISGGVQVVQVEAKTAEEAREKLAAYEATQHDKLRATSEELTKDPASVDEFYTEALAVIEYLTARGGLPFFRFVVVQQNYGKVMDEVLREWPAKQREVERMRPAAEKEAATRKQPVVPLAKGDPAGPLPPWPISIAGVLVRRGEAVNPMPASVDALEADFVQWVKKNYPKYHPELPPSPHK